MLPPILRDIRETSVEKRMLFIKSSCRTSLQIAANEWKLTNEGSPIDLMLPELHQTLVFFADHDFIIDYDLSVDFMELDQHTAQHTILVAILFEDNTEHNLQFCIKCEY